MKLMFLVTLSLVIISCVLHMKSSKDSVTIEPNLVKSESPSSLKQLSISTRLLNDEESDEKPVWMK